MTLILIVEDDLAISQLYVQILETMGFQAIKANNGINGIKMAIDEKPDLIICDITMPGFNGLEVYKILPLFKS